MQANSTTIQQPAEHAYTSHNQQPTYQTTALASDQYPSHTTQHHPNRYVAPNQYVAPIDKHSPDQTRAKVGRAPECPDSGSRGTGATPRRPQARPDTTA